MTGSHTDSHRPNELESIAIDDDPRRLLEFIIVASLVPIAGITVGWPGIVLGGLVVGTWYRFGTVAAIALAHVGLLPLVPALDVSVLWPLWLALGLLLLAPTLQAPHPARFALGTLGSLIFLGGLLIFGLSRNSTPIAALLVLVGFALASYALYRYELVALGHVSDESETPTEPSQTPGQTDGIHE